MIDTASEPASKRLRGLQDNGWLSPVEISQLIVDVERLELRPESRSYGPPTRCDYDGCEIAHPRLGQRFGSERCRQAWHREHSPRGVVKGVRKLGNGGTSIVLHFAEADAEVALRFLVKQRVVLGRLDEGDDNVRVPIKLVTERAALVEQG